MFDESCWIPVTPHCLLDRAYSLNGVWIGLLQEDKTGNPTGLISG